jgi:hypothetical protein
MIFVRSEMFSSFNLAEWGISCKNANVPPMKAVSYCSPPGINFLERPAVWAEQGVVCFKR